MSDPEDPLSAAAEALNAVVLTFAGVIAAAVVLGLGLAGLAYLWSN